MPARNPSAGAPLNEKTTVRRGSGKKATGPTWKGFVDCELTTEDKFTLKTTDVFATYPIMITLSLMVVGHYKVSLSLDTKNHTCIASMTDNDPSSDTQGYTLTGRGANVENALASLFYKHFYKLADGWETPSERDTEYG